ncbi:GNAT N-acetyltransferase [Rathayibacter sp. VKM Ac-2878]|nr:GNAT N-acetyltransferase [Rathayibacter sp. VKM Ac-2878]
MKIELMPMDDSALVRFERAVLSPAGTGEFQWFGFTDLSQVRARFKSDGLLGDQGGGGMLAVQLDTQQVGRVEWFSSRWGRSSSTCWTIAVGIDEGHRGLGIGTAAHQLLVDYLFRHTRVERIQAYTDERNVHERKALTSAGFSQEGILRRAQWRDGGWRDMALYSRLREAS